MARITNWSATIGHFNGKWWTRNDRKKTVVVQGSVPSGAASAAIRKYRKYHIEKGTRIEGYQITLLRLPTIQTGEEE